MGAGADAGDVLQLLFSLNGTMKVGLRNGMFQPTSPAATKAAPIYTVYGVWSGLSCFST
jgi:hypothetical protein